MNRNLYRSRTSSTLQNLVCRGRYIRDGVLTRIVLWWSAFTALTENHIANSMLDETSEGV
jgi:hypothetical protein